MKDLELMGFISVIVLNIGWWIQVYHVLKTKHIKGISRPFLATLFISFIFLQYYTWSIRSWVYLIGNGIGMGGIGVLLILTKIYRNKYTDAPERPERPNKSKVGE